MRCPPSLQADPFVHPHARRVCSPVTLCLDRQSDGALAPLRAQFFLCQLCLFQSRHLGAAPQTLNVPENTTLTQSELSLVWTVDVVEMMMIMIYICANSRLTAPKTAANGADVTAGISVKSLLWDVVKVEKRVALQARTILEETVLWEVVNVKQRAVLQAETILDETVQHIDPDTGATAAATTEQTAGQNQADGVSVFVAAAAASAMGSWVGWIQGKFLWAPSLP